MSKRFSRWFLVLMTALSLWGAWLCPVRLALPEADGGVLRAGYGLIDGSYYYFKIEGRDFIAWIHAERYTEGALAHRFDTFLADEDKEAFRAHLAALSLHRSSFSNIPGFQSPRNGVVYDIDISFAPCGSAHILRLSHIDGRVKGVAYTRGRIFWISNPAPLLEFLQEHVPVPA